MRAVRLCSSPQLAVAVSAYRKALLAREENPPGEDLPAREARIARADRELNVQAAKLGGLLLPLHPSSGIHRLVVIPDNIIASVPFSALRLGPGDGFLIENYEVTEEPSAAVAMELLSRPAALPNREAIAVFADPVYNLLDPRLAKARSGASAVRVAANSVPAASSHPQVPAPVLRSDADLDLGALPRLRGSEEEAQAISSIAGADRVHLYLGFQATPAAVMETDWSHYSIAHFATHAVVDSARPELSGIILSTLGKDGSPQNGILWLHDIYRTPMPLPLVVLSGCRTADGTEIPGEGISGLAQAFLSSGASAVVGSLWTVDDAAAGKMVPWFYQTLLNQHLSISGALRAAQLRMLAAKVVRRTIGPATSSKAIGGLEPLRLFISSYLLLCSPMTQDLDKTALQALLDALGPTPAEAGAAYEGHARALDPVLPMESLPVSRGARRHRARPSGGQALPRCGTHSFSGAICCRHCPHAASGAAR